MAYVEMRMILVRMLWNFDYKLCDESQNWLDQKVYLVWRKNPLMVQLKPRKDPILAGEVSMNSKVES
jgi:hypothetical protein